MQDRRQTHAAATTAAEEGARLALKAAEHAAKLREDALKEREELKKKNNLSFSQKVRPLAPLCMMGRRQEEAYWASQHPS